MTDIDPEALQIFDEYAAVIRKCRRELTSQNWFGADWWINSSFDRNGFTFQLAKTHWYNHNGQGIHFEFWLEGQEMESKELPMVLHFESDVPSRRELGDRFETAFATVQSSFDDYRVNHKAICDKLSKQVALSKSKLPATIVKEFTRLQEIGPIIDLILRQK